MRRMSLRVLYAFVGMVLTLPLVAIATAPGVTAVPAVPMVQAPALPHAASVSNENVLGAPPVATNLPIGPVPRRGLIRLPGHVLDALSKATMLDRGEGQSSPKATGTKAHEQPLTLTFVLKREDQAGFDQYMHDVYDPNSKTYRQFMTQAQLAMRFGPSAAHYGSIVHYLRKSGFTHLERSRNRMTVVARAKRTTVERVFDLRIADYRIGDHTFYANDYDPAMPTIMAAQIQAISGLSDLGAPRRVLENFAGICHFLAGNDILEVGGLLKILFIDLTDVELAALLGGFAVAAAPEVIATAVGVGVSVAACAAVENYAEYAKKYPNPNDPNLPPILRGFGQANHYPQYLQGQLSGGGQVRAQRSARSQTQAAPATTSPSTSIVYPDGYGQTIGLLEFDTFNTSDVSNFINYISALGGYAGDIKNLSVKAVNGGVSAPGAGEEEVLLDIDAAMGIAPGAKVVVYDAPFNGQTTSYTAIFNAMINDGVNVISNSWASCEDQVSLAEAQGIDSVLQTAAASGISVFNGAGDTGSTCLDGSANTIEVPADSPSATAVGGTSLTFGPDLLYGSETWWDGSTHSPATGQGGYGVSKYFSRPSYQSAINTSMMRSIPDVTAAADPAAGGIQICQADNGGCPSGKVVGGTSLSTPVWAGFAALLNEAEGKSHGAFNPLLYPLANTPAFHSAASMGTDFAHVGLGSPDLNAMERLLTGRTLGLPDANWSTTESLISTNISSSNGIVGVSADGTSKAGVLVTLRDAQGGLVVGKTVTLAASGGSATISPAASVTTDSNGAAVFTLTDSVPETLTFTATDTTDGIVLPTAASLTFAVPKAASAGISANPSAVAADNSSTTTLTVVLKDSLGRPAPGKLVNIQQGNGHSVIKGPTPSVTDSTGQIQFTATDDQTETVTYTANDVSDGNLPVPGSGTVTFSSAGSSDCTANPAVGANGYVVTTFASNFPASDFFFSDINYSGCPGANNPFFSSSGSVVITDFNTGDVYQTSVSGGPVNSSDVIVNLGQSVGVPVVGKDGSLYAARYGTNGYFTSGDVIQINPTTFALVREVATGLTCPSSLVVDPISGDLFFDDQCTGAGSDNPSVFRITDPSGANPTLSTYATLPVSGGQQEMAFAPDGTLYAISGGFANTSEVVSVTGTNSTNPGTVSVISGITPDNGSLNIGQVNADGSAKTLLLHVADNNGSLETVDITTSPPTVATVLANGDIGAGVVGPDGCFYAGAHHVVYKLAPASSPCTLTPTVTGPSLTLSPASVSPNPAQGTTQTFSATLKNVASQAGVPVLFFVNGANAQSQLVITDANGNAPFSYTAVAAGTDTIVATTTVTPTVLKSNRVQVVWTAGKHSSFLTLNTGPQGGTVNKPVTVIASLADLSGNPTVPIVDQSVTFTLGNATCNAITDSNGNASCSLTPLQLGVTTLTASFAGTSQFVSAKASSGFRVSEAPAPAPTVTITASPATIAAGSAATLTWSSTNATACTASGAWSGTQATSGTLSVTPTTSGSYSYTLTCTGTGGSGAATAVLSATLVAVTAKSGGGAVGWYLLLFLVVLVVVRYRTSPLRPRELIRDGAGIALVATLLAFGAIDSVRAQSTTSSSAASPAFDPFYVGIRVGGMPVRQGSGRIDQGLADRGFGDVTASSDTSGTAGTLFVGYEFASYAAVELGYTFRESTAAHLNGTIGSTANLTPLLQNTTELIRGYGNIVSLSYAGRFELLPRFSLEPRLGGFFWATKVSAIGLDDRIDTTHEGGGVTAGLTAAYRVWRGLELGVSVDHYRGSPSNIATLYAGTLLWRFGR